MMTIPNEAVEAAIKKVGDIKAGYSGVIHCAPPTLRSEMSSDLLRLIVEAALEAALPFLVPKPTAGQLNVGDHVNKASGYRFPGTVRSVFQTKAGETRYVVELDGYGVLHIFAEGQLGRVPNAGPKPSENEVERVARAICSASDCDPDRMIEETPGTGWGYSAWGSFIELARAAIAAMNHDNSSQRARDLQAQLTWIYVL